MPEERERAAGESAPPRYDDYVRPQPRPKAQAIPTEAQAPVRRWRLPKIMSGPELLGSALALSIAAAADVVLWRATDGGLKGVFVPIVGGAMAIFFGVRAWLTQTTIAIALRYAWEAKENQAFRGMLVVGAGLVGALVRLYLAFR